MARIRFRSVRSRLALAVAVAAAVIAPVVAVAGPATASLSGKGWVMQSLPANYEIGSGGVPPAPVSCARGTRFCVVIINDTAVTGPGGVIGQAALVSTDGGTSWTGYTGPWGAYVTFNSISCVSASVCWAAGTDKTGSGAVAESTDGGKTWTLKTPAFLADSGGTRTPNSIDCVSATTCWLAGVSQPTSQGPEVDETTNGGATWTSFSNLPTIPRYDPDGTYTLDGISCTSALACVVVGGLTYYDGKAQVIATTDGGATWSLSSDPTLAGLQSLFSVACLPVSGGLPTCHAAGNVGAGGGPAIVTSTDGGATWGGVETDDNTGWLDSISCPDVQHCWAAGAGTDVALLGTSDGGSAWTAVTSDTTNEEGEVSCATVSVCVATTDNALWVTTSGGGLGTAARTRPLAGARVSADVSSQPVTQRLPHVSGSTVFARTGTRTTITGQYRSTAAASTATVTITSPAGQQTSSSVPIGLNNFYSEPVSNFAAGTTTITFAAGNAPAVSVRLDGHTGPAPAISALSSHAGPATGGSSLTISGTKFSKVTGVYIGARKATKVTTLSTTRLRVRAPAGTGAQFVRVFTANGGESALTGKAVYNFLPGPALTGLSPASGRAAGGTTVTITGTGFGYVTAVYFGSRKGSHLRVISPEEIKVAAPRGSGKVNVRVHTAGGITPVTAKDHYTY